MLDWLRGLAADHARSLALKNRHRGDLIIAEAKIAAAKANARSEFWSDVQAWLDGLDTWGHLSESRKHRLRFLYGPRARAQ